MENVKAEHWRLGAEVAGYLFGARGYELCAGHSKASMETQSRLYLADKHSWGVAPTWWLWWQCVVEPGCHRGHGIREHVRNFQAWVRENLSRPDGPRETHNAVAELQGKQ